MAVQLALPIVAGEPRLDKTGAAFGIARFVIDVRAGMRSKGVVRVERQRPLDLTRAGRDIACLDASPAEIGQEPPILVPLGASRSSSASCASWWSTRPLKPNRPKTPSAGDNASASRG